LYPNPGDFKAPLVFATDDVKSVSEASSRFLDSKGRLFTTPIVSTATTSADLLLNQYVLNDSGIKPLLLINSLKLGTVAQSTPVGSVSVANQLTILNRNADGSIVLAGTTSGTVTIGSSRFTGSPAAPAQFLVTISPEMSNQTLTTEQIGWALNLPAATRRVIANGRQQTWVQLPDSVFRYYDPKGRLVWEKKLITQGVYELGADLKGNLYVMSADSVNTFDSTGTFRWKLAYRKGPNAYDRKLYIKPTGGGVATCITDNLNGNQRVTEFTDDGKDISQFLAWNWGGSLRDSYSLANLVPLSSKQMAWFFVNNRSNPGLPNTAFPLVYNNAAASSFVENILKWKTYSVPNIDPDYRTDTLPLTTLGLHRWSRAATNAVYLFQSQNTTLPAQQRVLTYGYSLTQFDSTGKTVFDEANTLRINKLAVAKSIALNSARTLFTLHTNTRLETIATTSHDLVLSQYDPDLNLRNTTQLGTFTLVNGQPDKTAWNLVEAYADGSLLLSGITSGTLTIGTNTYAGSSAAPVRFLALINTTLAQVTAPATAICQSSTATLKARYKGYLDQQPVVQLSNAAGSFAQPALSLIVPLSRSAVVDTTLTSLSLPIPATLTAGTYRLRTLLGTFVSEQTSLTVLATPTASTVTQQGDELVSTTSATGTYQWYDAQNKPISGATTARYKPQAGGGSYYLINTANGCASAPSNTIAYVITATEPLIAVEVYPNPTADRLFVRWPGAAAGARIRLLNAQGRVMQDVPRQGDVTDVPTQGLTSGLVLVQMQVEGQPMQVRKVLIQR
ncbi:MAG: T9SS type A sorting domain-containing protein, partial [Cytophagaceae bacterium]